METLTFDQKNGYISNEVMVQSAALVVTLNPDEQGSVGIIRTPSDDQTIVELFNILAHKFPKFTDLIKTGLDLNTNMLQPTQSIIQALKRAQASVIKNKWDKIYIAVDLHGTCLHPDYENTATTFYDYAKEVLRYFTLRQDVVLIMYTCSKQDEIVKYVEFFAQHGIKFDYINENPDVKKTRFGDFTTKPYFNLLFEDKAGFNPFTDWLTLYNHYDLNNFYANDETVPYGVCALVKGENGTYLGVTRKYDHNDWGLPGGKIEAGESPFDAFVRELREETGYIVNEVTSPIILDGRKNVYVYPYTINEGDKKADLPAEETGLVDFVLPETLMSGSFGEYNRNLFSFLKEINY